MASPVPTSYRHKIPLVSATGTIATGYPWPGGVCTIECGGTFNGASITLNHSPDGGTTWFPIQTDNTTAGSPGVIAITGTTSINVFVGLGLIQIVVTGTTTSVTLFMTAMSSGQG